MRRVPGEQPQPLQLPSPSSSVNEAIWGRGLHPGVCRPRGDLDQIPGVAGIGPSVNHWFRLSNGDSMCRETSLSPSSEPEITHPAPRMAKAPASDLGDDQGQRLGAGCSSPLPSAEPDGGCIISHPPHKGHQSRGASHPTSA